MYPPRRRRRRRQDRFTAHAALVTTGQWCCRRWRCGHQPHCPPLSTIRHLRAICHYHSPSSPAPSPVSLALAASPSVSTLLVADGGMHEVSDVVLFVVPRRCIERVDRFRALPCSQARLQSSQRTNASLSGCRIAGRWVAAASYTLSQGGRRLSRRRQTNMVARLRG